MLAANVFFPPEFCSYTSQGGSAPAIVIAQFYVGSNVSSPLIDLLDFFCGIGTSVVDRHESAIVHARVGDTLVIMGNLQVSADALANFVPSPVSLALSSSDANSAGAAFCIDVVTDGVTYVTASGTNYRSCGPPPPTLCGDDRDKIVQVLKVG